MRRLMGVLLLVVFLLSGCASARNTQFAQEYAATLYNLGNSYRELRNYPEAVASYREALLVDPTLDVARVNLYVTYMDLKAYEEALNLIIQLAADYPDNVTYQKQLAYTYYMNGKLFAARQVYESLYEQDPEDYDALTNVAKLYVLEKDYPHARDAYALLHELDAADSSVYMKLGEIEEQIESTGVEEALRWYELAASFSETPESLESIIRLAAQAKNHKKVYNTYDRLEEVTASPGEPTFRKSQYAFLITQDYLVGLDLLAESMKLGFEDWEAVANFKGLPEMEPFSQQVDIIISLYMKDDESLLEEDLMMPEEEGNL